jgi:LuxR family maltose regulon positive regulatory protein
MLAADEAAGRTGNMIAVLVLLTLANLQAGNTEEAMRVLDRALALAEPEGYVRVFVDAGPAMEALLAAWLASSTRQQDVRGTRARASYVEKLLATFPSKETQHGKDRKDIERRETVASHSPLIEPLTSREQDVLELLAEGLSNAEIAARLVVTVGTVKTYIKGIYGKLAVHSRTQAILRARELGLL